jgi:uncharacterized protein (DUF2461 family)
MLGKCAFLKCFPKGLSREDMISRPPKGYDEGNPAIEYLKLKSFVVMTDFDDKDALAKSFLKHLVKTFETMKPFVDFLNRSLE